MRVISGTYGGRPLQTLKGEATRPTTDRVKEALMSAVASRLGTFEGAHVLDAFAGSGALGIEALSRGAEHVWFCEQSGKAFATVKQNLQTLGVPAQHYTLHKGDVFSLANTPNTPSLPTFNLAFFDPPYATPATQVMQLAESLYAAGAFDKTTYVYYEHDQSSETAVESAAVALQWQTVTQKRYGRTTISLLRKDAP